MKVGDLIQVTEPRSMGGRPMGAIGLVLEKHSSTPAGARWRIWWMSDTSVSWCKGVGVLNESR